MQALAGQYHTLDESVEGWAAIRTAARWEKKAADILSALGIPVFLPIFQRVTRYKTRTAHSEIPLFGGYLFFDESRLAGVNGLSPAHKKYVAQVLRTSDPMRLRAELARISEVMADYGLIQAKLFGSIGDTVRIRNGAFAQYEGQIVRYGATHQRLVLNVSYLGLSVEVEIDDHSTEKVH